MAAVCALAITACNSEKSYTISGEFDLPMTFEYGDSVIERPSLEGMSVYLYDLDENVVDSAVVDADEHFAFQGSIKSEDSKFLFLVTGIASGMFVLEPGEISAVIGEDLTITGTSLNDGITDLNSAVSNLQQDAFMQYSALADSLGDQLNDSHLQSLYETSMQQTELLLDSFYHANSDNLIGVYAVHFKTSQATTAQELDAALADYDDYMRSQPLFMSRRSYYLQMEEQLSSRDFDPSIFEMDQDSVK